MTPESGAVGYDRVREALSAHIWPSSDPLSTAQPKVRAPQVASAFDDDFSPFVSADSVTEPFSLQAADEEAHPLDPFESLAGMMSQLKSMRERALEMPDDEARKDYAEKVRFIVHLRKTTDLIL